MAIGRESMPVQKVGTRGHALESPHTAEAVALNGTIPADEVGGIERGADERADAPLRRVQRGVVQFPMQILVPEETRNALRQRSEETGASIRHIILRSLAADGFPVPRLTRRR